MDTKTKIHTIISIVLLTLITALIYWIQLPSENLKAQVIDHKDTVLVRIQDYAFDPDIVRVEPDTTVSWLNDETEANADVQHIVLSYDPDDPSTEGDEFESDYLSLGDTFSYNFDDAGVYYYSNSIYPFMLGKVCVGAESEALDDDCTIDLTQTSASDEETLDDEDTLGLEDEEEFLLDDAEEEAFEEPEDIDDEFVFDPIDDTTDDMMLDDEIEDFVPQVETTDEEVMVIDVRHSAAESVDEDHEEDTELVDSGPEYLIYFLVGIFALYSARKFTRFNV